ncbi:MAG: hypothetical protein JNG88_17185 [Phycisphaerales bacterium]|nr:hypothetical protein [Phycisphaerales bacterium]
MRLIRARFALAALIAGALAGCKSIDPPPFSFAGTNIVWPPPPDQPRVRYIGAISGEADLGRKKSAGEALTEVLQGPRPRISFSTPVAVAADGRRVWVADPAQPGGPCVHAIDLEARSLTLIREVAGAPLQWPIDVAWYDGSLAIADARRAAVFMTSINGGATRTIGSGVLKRPASVTWVADRLYVLDAGLHAVIMFDQIGREVGRFGQRGTRAGEFNFPSAICAVPAMNGISPGAAARAVDITGAWEIAIADAMNFRVQLVDEIGRPLRTFGQKGDAAGDFSLPRDIATDRAGRLCVLDNQFENIQIFDREARLLMALGRGGNGPGQFNLPSGIAIDDEQRIWVADTYNRRVQVFELLPELPS